MNRHVNAIAGRLSLRPPRRRSLEILDHVTEIVPPKKGADLDAAVKWCRHATHHAVSNDGKPWKYLFIPHDAIAENMTLTGLASLFLVR